MVNAPVHPSLAAAPARILIVEDEGIISSHIASLLARSGFQVAGIAESSEEALAKMGELNPDLVLMDIHIKGKKDGIETVAALREHWDIPVIYVTAHMDGDTIGRAKITGASGFLTKPIHGSLLAVTIEMAIHKHRAERGEKQQRAWMATVLGTLADAVAVVDGEGKVQFLNGLAEELTGWTNEMAGDVDLALVLPLATAGLPVTAAELSPPVQVQRDLPQGLTATGRSGKRFPVEGEIAVSMLGGRVMGTVITFRDATARVARQNQLRQESKMQAVGHLAAGIAHDFNNLLFVILGYTEELLGIPGSSPRTVKALTEIRKAGESANAITRQLLKFSRPEPVHRQDLELNRIILDSEGIFRRLCGPGVNLSFSLAVQLGTVRADPGQLQQILMNLLVNARDAMPAGGQVTVETARMTIPHAPALPGVAADFIGLTVRDTGSGMSAETAEHLFEPFFTTKASGEGTGLGLSIVHSIVTDLGGTIQVESEPGHGAVFTVFLPQTATVTGGQASAAPVAGNRAEVPATVLLVEDQEGVRQMLRNVLEASGCKVLEAVNGEDAIRLASEHAGVIDVLVTDVVMPKAGGFEVARALATQRVDMKVIFISGYAQKLLDGRETIPAGAVFLPKPFVMKELLKKISDLQGGKREGIGRTD